MAMKREYGLGIASKVRLLDSINGAQRLENWSFEYITTNADSTDAADYPNKQLQPKKDYPDNTIFLDAGDAVFSIYSTMEDVYIDNSPISLKVADIQYKTINANHKCKVVVDSHTPIDILNIGIYLGDLDGTPLYEMSRKDDEVIETKYISNINISKHDTIYTLTFDVSKDLSCDDLNANQITVCLWNISGTKFVYTSDGHWAVIDANYNLGNLIPLKIKLTDITPDNRIIVSNTVGKIKVTINNYNQDFWSLCPKFELDVKSIGSIDNSTVSYNENTGELQFWVTNIQSNGYVIINTWLDIDNTNIVGRLKNATFATAKDGEWYWGSEGRKINIKQYVPGFLGSDQVHRFVKSTEDFLNTMYKSLSDNTKNIGILEKVYRISNFNNVKKIEDTVMEEYKKQYGITVDPNIEVFKKFLETKKVETTVEETPDIDDESSDIDLEDIDTDTVLKTSVNNDAVDNTLKNQIFTDLTSKELYTFMKEIYANTPYYNQLAGTYRGITFMLNQLGLCCKLVEIWSDRVIQDNFNKDNRLFREDELNAVRYNNEGAISSIGRYFLTSRFDVDLQESGLTFEEFNDLSFNIVKLILSVKPIHRVLRNLTYIFIANTDLHFQHILMDGLGNNYKNENGDNCTNEIRYYNYTWNLFDDYAIQKSDVFSDGTAIISNKIFVPFTSINAVVKHNRSLYNVFGEIKKDPITGENKKFIWGKYDGQEKPINEPLDPPAIDDFIPAVKNTYHNLCNIENKFKKSYQEDLGLKLLYVEQWYADNGTTKIVAYNGQKRVVLFNSDIQNSSEITDEESASSEAAQTFNSKNLTYQIYDEELDEAITYNFVDYVIDKEALWTPIKFIIGKNVEVKSATNGFYLNISSGGQRFLNSIGLTTNFNDNYMVEEDGTTYNVMPVCLLMRMENIGISLGTNYLIQDNSNFVLKTYHLLSEQSDKLVSELESIRLRKESELED